MLGFINLASPSHILVIGLIALLLFGNRLPEVARSLGRALNEFKRGIKEVGDEIDDADRKIDSTAQRRDKLRPPSSSEARYERSEEREEKTEDAERR